MLQLWYDVILSCRLTLLYNSVLFFSREALRKVCLTETAEEKKWRHVFNLMWCTYVITYEGVVMCGGGSGQQYV
jgi:hypothetical protein